jgi:hypothetical protein
MCRLGITTLLPLCSMSASFVSARVIPRSLSHKISLISGLLGTFRRTSFAVVGVVGNRLLFANVVCVIYGGKVDPPYIWLLLCQSLFYESFIFTYHQY